MTLPRWLYRWWYGPWMEVRGGSPVQFGIHHPEACFDGVYGRIVCWASVMDPSRRMVTLEPPKSGDEE